MGNRTEIDYSGEAYSVDESCPYGEEGIALTVCQPFPGQMVSEVRQFERFTDGSLKSLFHSEYFYRNIRHGLGGHGSYGPEETVVDTYGQDNFIAESVEKTFINTNWIFAGVVESELNLSPSSEPPFSAGDGPRYKNETETRNRWVRETSDAGRPFPALSESISNYFVQSAGGADRTLMLRQTLDQSTEAYGNIQDRTTSILQPASAGDSTLRTVYSIAEDFCYAHDPWCDLSPKDPKFARNGLTALARTARIRKQRLKDDGTLEVVATKFTRTFDPDTGLMMSATRHGDVDQQLETALVHDQFGNLVDHVVQIADAPPRHSARYFDVRGLYPTMLENELGHITYQDFDELTGAIAYYRDENDLETVIDYDAFGRPTAQQDWQKSVTVSYNDPAQAPWNGNGLIRASDHAKLRVSTQVAGGMRRDVDLDAFERAVMSREVGYGGEWVTTTTEYDWRGNVDRATRPHSGSSTSGNSTAPGMVEYAYDNWGRLKYEYFPDNTHIRHRYVPKIAAEADNPWFSHPEAAFAELVSARATNADAETTERVLVFNALGQVVTSIDAEDTKTNYEFGAAGKVTRVEHVAGETDASNFTSYQHDEFGRLLSLIDPDIGRLDYKYNGFDELIEVSDARGLVTDIHYDDLGRTVRQVDNWHDRAPEETSWVYDTADNGVGRLHYTVSPDGVFEAAEYYSSTDPQAGLLKAQSLSVEGETYTAAFKYDAYKRLQVVQYPEVAGQRFETVNSYDPSGLLTRVRAAPGGVVDEIIDVWEFKGAHQGYLVNDVEVGLSRQ
ncbi:MAG TPA: hypothetical protein VN764_18505, partial [Polyangiaceae bacterium]|nr:hypothetical protein [Polyangiaceae bacterium]